MDDRKISERLDLDTTALSSPDRDDLDRNLPSAEAAWRAENREAIESFNRAVAEHGMPLAKYSKLIVG